MKLKVFAIVALVVAGGVAVVASLGGLPLTGQADATQYLTAAATTGDVTDEVAATGSIAAARTYAMGFGAPPQATTDTSASVGSGTWTVTEVNAEVGHAVKAGEVLARASTADLRSQLVIAQSSLRAARLQEKEAKTNLDNASGTSATRQARAAHYNAVNARRQAQQAVADLVDQIGLAVIKAPIDGTITAVNIVQGLDSTGTAITLASSEYEVTADVVESDISSMSVGQPATVTVGAIDGVIGGTVSAIAPAASSSGGSGSVVSYPVTVTLTGAPAALRAGMTADITIVTASANGVLTIPAEALRGTTGNYRVQVLGADGKPTTKAVTVGLVTNTTAEIKDGLAAGDTVITGTASSRIASSGSNSGGAGFGRGVVVDGGGPGVFTRP
jgi:macrolide-specific efflux system membrane fusion protein